MRVIILPFLLFLLTIQGFAQTTMLRVVAKQGDGIYTLLRRHGLTPSHLQHFLELNKDNLGENNSLYVGRTYVLPATTAIEASTTAVSTSKPSEASSSRVKYVSLFGNKYERVEVLDQKLKGAVYYLVGGHGGPDPGAVGKYGPYSLAEDEYAYDVTLRLARRLMEHGATVYTIVQDKDDGIRDESILKMDRDEVNYNGQAISLSQTQRLRQRVNSINSLYGKHKGAYQRMLSLHIDSRSERKNIDVFFYHHENSADGQKLAESIHQTFNNKYNRHQPERSYTGTVSHRSSLYVVKYSHPPTVFIELGNIRNNLDQRRFVIPNNRQALANWICEGIIRDYKNK
ncbi:N-acetylmuramoyl-L-alanine amidase [uncultured Pontibacter sp.]|uniref:N-acetylmuramoyl-L-alanine amidase family protein n=1 Tax=uncultured Pontibacter sp. TaxID=453356 RepID=UPI00262F8CE3|nr:N-acetylmuramoyl-L-alanine amidase [uncultured Pontibacter sp.]